LIQGPATKRKTGKRSNTRCSKKASPTIEEGPTSGKEEGRPKTGSNQ